VPTLELLATLVAGAVGAALVVLAVGASLLLIVPAVVTVGAVSLVADRTRRSR
jgi:hypothetical protein